MNRPDGWGARPAYSRERGGVRGALAEAVRRLLEADAAGLEERIMRGAGAPPPRPFLRGRTQTGRLMGRPAPAYVPTVIDVGC